ncbi:putative bifunctional diguanylate cyclase/phosphodiesterase, partial [Pararhizobium arenae]|uniref:putative bifunctional diguanylate cyclase/phosphodiesterase n=1 Tax=Pararhizobium arenae TaxID=1856850 RepID=UPI00094B702A
FKEVNDTHGHAAGDSLLQAIGVRLSYLLSSGTTIARLGGDEFAVLFPTGDPLEAQSEAAAILNAFRKPFTLGPLVLDLGASLGIALAPNHGADAEELLASADFALYRAKAASGGCYRMFDHSMRSEAQARRATRDELRRALRHGELLMRYQPQVNLPSKEITGFEALIRWRHPERGLLSPSAFLPALEQSALALEIGWWTLEEACRTASRLNSAGGSLKVSVNLFPTQFRALNLCDRVQNSMDEYGIKPEWLELEVTEQVALLDDEKAFRTLTALREIGVGVAFDDFGTGYASLSSLQRFPITTLKIDRGFVEELGSSASDAAITRALIGMSKDMGLNTIAEGIETEVQENVLLGMGCPSGQGYRYGRPMDEDDIYGLVESHVAQTA